MALKELWEEDGVTCPKCGARNPSEAVFCIKCGYRLRVEKTLDVSKLLLNVVLLVSVTALIDLLFNRGVSILAEANAVFRALFVVGLVSNLILIYIWYRYRGETSFPKEGSIYTLFIISLVASLAVYLVYYGTFFIANTITISPLWIVYGWIIYRVTRK